MLMFLIVLALSRTATGSTTDKGRVSAPSISATIRGSIVSTCDQSNSAVTYSTVESRSGTWIVKENICTAE